MDNQKKSKTSSSVQDELRAMQEKCRVIAQDLIEVKKELTRIESKSVSEPTSQESKAIASGRPAFVNKNAPVYYLDSNGNEVVAKLEKIPQKCSDCPFVSSESKYRDYDDLEGFDIFDERISCKANGMLINSFRSEGCNHFDCFQGQETLKTKPDNCPLYQKIPMNEVKTEPLVQPVSANMGTSLTAAGSSSGTKAEDQSCTDCLGWDWTAGDCTRMRCIFNKHKYGEVAGASDLWPKG